MSRMGKPGKRFNKSTVMLWGSQGIYVGEELIKNWHDCGQDQFLCDVVTRFISELGIKCYRGNIMYHGESESVYVELGSIGQEAT